MSFQISECHLTYMEYPYNVASTWFFLRHFTPYIEHAVGVLNGGMACSNQWSQHNLPVCLRLL